MFSASRSVERGFFSALLLFYGVTLILVERFYLFIPDLLALFSVGLLICRRMYFLKTQKVFFLALTLALLPGLIHFLMGTGSDGYILRPARALIYLPVGAMLYYYRIHRDIFFLGLALGMIALLAILLVNDSPLTERLSLWANPIPVAEVCVGIFFLLIAGLKSKSGAQNACIILGQFSCLFLLYLSHTRGAFLSFLCTGLYAIIFLYFEKSGKNSKVIIVGVFIMFSFAFLLLPQSDRILATKDQIVAYEEGVKNTSVGIRLELWKASLHLARDRPMLGFGDLGKIEGATRLIENGDADPLVLDQPHFHSDYFEALATGGILGLFSFLAVLIAPFVLFYRERKSQPLLALASTAFILSFAISALTDVPFRNGLTNMFYSFSIFALLAFFASSSSGNEERPREN